MKFSEEKKVFEAVLFAVRTALNKGASYSVPEKHEENHIVFPDFAPTAKPLPQAPQMPQNKAQSSYIPDIPKSDEKPKMSVCEFVRQIGVDTSAIPKQSTETYRKEDLEEKKREPIKEPEEKSPRVPDFKNAFSSEFEGIAEMVAKPSNTELFVRSSIPQASMEIFSPAPKASAPEVKNDAPEIGQVSFDLETENKSNSEKAVKFRVIGECFDSFILVEKDDVLYVIDKHAAHERILYEEIKGIAKDASSQTLLEPERIPLSTEEFAAVSENIEYFDKTGFIIDLFGTNSILVRAYPSHISQSDLSDVFTSIAAKLLEGNGHAAGDLFDRALFSAACKAAVKAGQRNTIFRDEEIAQKIFSSDAILYCPHGRPVITEFTKEKLYKMFKRT